jgi:tripartite-type tricarboxylate transporter receptor subunit TctC
MLNRRYFITASTASILASRHSTFAEATLAQSIAKPAHLIVGFPPGGAPDVLARLLAEHMKGYAPSFIVENRPGAGGRVALEALKGAVADGSVMALTPVDQLALFPHVYAQLGYRPLEDFVAVTPVCAVQFLITIGPRVPAEVATIGEFVRWCQDNPKAATYGTAGAGTHPHFLGISFSRAAHFDFVHVPYKGGVTVMQDVIGGHIAACISTIGTLLPSIQSSDLRALATSAPARSSALPNVPTLREAGYPTLESIERFGVIVPAGTPVDTVDRLCQSFRGALAAESVRVGMAKLCLEPLQGSSAEFTALIAFETQRWAEVVKASGFQPME